MGAWGYCLFQSDHDFDVISEMSHEAGLAKLEEDAQARAKAEGKSDKEVNLIYYTIYSNDCSDPELVRKHLDSGVLVDMIAKKESKMLSKLDGSLDQRLDYLTRDPCYAYVLLGACAMTLGCQLPEAYVSMLKKVYTEGGIMADAQRQMRKALFGPGGYKNGKPYDFESKTLSETADSSATEEHDVNPLGFRPLNVLSPGGLFETGMTTSTTSLILKELRAQIHEPDACGGCGAEHRAGGKALLMCSKCHNRKYCSVKCQKKSWKVHRKVCVPPKASA
ncbi:hypothetical protein COCC4DRAFT_41685 [Bipolaris maydis ATCC 48331]|uniref:MYND-type domain-containing protein n=2 Tax=Cochliobolus heterostrophus TaxID=5016 RepID=M2VAY9_COCH5|nr:uncharacterized protein COCC4DRAFT_41685 [Bipolaris maydis ATCC 48331]EMD96833.1 hypothetical protein COCHEDRAFT_1150514 [Bipolaris maydis C5]KAJ5031287.1 hypothetical protein J3E73DRAFT_178528 [Bipolaris maydis]ENI03701.1 hypothetical protein COCC4DRAFT_41685 [Bipolaris maydis ATCC 48331]KAJ5052986.1 hypothetical protein J3E74DRAFT_228765 [Bipolaris maydis]KAJ5060658.1 hypothetical protein J3E74DRAFT_215026 [Bipolaris maydis]